MTNYLVYICQAVRDRAGLERYWMEAPAAYPKSDVKVLAGYGPCEVLDTDQDERVEGVVIAEFLPFEETIKWFNSAPYVQARQDRTNGNDYLGIVVESGNVPVSESGADKPAYVVAIFREIIDHEALNIYFQRVNDTLASYKARILVDRGRFEILEGSGPVQYITVYEFPSANTAKDWHNGAVYKEAIRHRKAGAKYFAVLTECGVPPIDQRMPHTKATRSETSR